MEHWVENTLGVLTKKLLRLACTELIGVYSRKAAFNRRVLSEHYLIFSLLKPGT
jgi:hypothetical protein